MRQCRWDFDLALHKHCLGSINRIHLPGFSEAALGRMHVQLITITPGISEGTYIGMVTHMQ